MNLQEFLESFRDPITNELPVMSQKFLGMVYEKLSRLPEKYLGRHILCLMVSGFQYLRIILDSDCTVNNTSILKWCSLYVSLQYRIIKNKKSLKKHFQDSIPAILEHIFEFLHCEDNSIASYYSTLLLQIELLIDLIQTKSKNIFKDYISKAIMYLWNAFVSAGDYETQFRAIKVLILVIQNSGIENSIDILKCIPSNHSDTIITEIRRIAVSKIPNITKALRKFSNEFNMNLNYRNAKVFSFHCLSISFGERYRFLRPNHGDRLWIDFNFRPRTISCTIQHSIRHSAIYQILRINLKIVTMKVHDGKLIIYYVRPSELLGQKTTNVLSECNKAVILLPVDQYHHLLNNARLLNHFKCYRKGFSCMQISKFYDYGICLDKDENDSGDEDDCFDSDTECDEGGNLNAVIKIEVDKDMKAGIPSNFAKVLKKDISTFDFSRAAGLEYKKSGDSTAGKQTNPAGRQTVKPVKTTWKPGKENNKNHQTTDYQPKMPNCKLNKSLVRRNRIAKKLDLARNK